jgi:hypothetical protein
VEYLHIRFGHFTLYVGDLNVRHLGAKIITEYGTNWGKNTVLVIPILLIDIPYPILYRSELRRYQRKTSEYELCMDEPLLHKGGKIDM